jgi:hypothetical protein
MVTQQRTFADWHQCTKASNGWCKATLRGQIPTGSIVIYTMVSDIPLPTTNTCFLVQLKVDNVEVYLMLKFLNRLWCNLGMAFLLRQHTRCVVYGRVCREEEYTDIVKQGCHDTRIHCSGIAIPTYLLYNVTYGQSSDPWWLRHCTIPCVPPVSKQPTSSSPHKHCHYQNHHRFTKRHLAWTSASFGSWH